MANPDEFEIFLMASPGLEPVLYAEVREGRYRAAREIAGGVIVRGGWKDVWRANLNLRGAGRVVARIASFHAARLDDLAARARQVRWREFLRPEVPVAVEATCRKSRIYHSGAAAERVASAISERLGAPVSNDAELIVRVRLDEDHCTIGIDTSGTLLHKRGHKTAVGRAPMRETMAALLLRQCGFDGREPVLDPMCGSGTFVIEAAEIALGLAPGRDRRFAFEQLATFDADAWQAMRAACQMRQVPEGVRFYGSDRDEVVLEAARVAAANSGVGAVTRFQRATVSEIVPPEGPSGLVIANPPYGGRIGESDRLAALYRALGNVLKERFSGWRVGLVTSEPRLARASGLSFEPPGPPLAHGGLKVRLFRTGPLP